MRGTTRNASLRGPPDLPPSPPPPALLGALLLLQLGAQLHERLPPQRGDVAGLDGLAHGATGLGLVAAVGETAAAQEAPELDVGLLQVARADPPQAEGAHA